MIVHQISFLDGVLLVIQFWRMLETSNELISGQGDTALRVWSREVSFR